MGIFKHWIFRLCFIIVSTIVIASCNRAPDILSGEIMFWVEIPPELTIEQYQERALIIGNLRDEFKELYPEINIYIKYFLFDEIKTPFELQAKRGAGPDIVLLRSTPQALHLIRAGVLKSIDYSDIDISQFRKEALYAIRYNDHLYGFPLLLETQTLCYNRDKVEELPSTLEDIIEQARKGYSIGIHSGFRETFWGTGIFGFHLFDEQGRLTAMRGDGWGQWMTWLKEAQNEPNVFFSSSASALQEAFVEGKLAYLTCATGSIAYLKEALGPDRLSVTLLPGDIEQPASPDLSTANLVFSRASNENQYKIAIAWAQFLTNVEQQEQVEAATPFIPSNVNVTIESQLFPLRSVLIEQSQTAVATPLDYIARVEAIDSVGKVLYRQVLDGGISPEKAANQLNEEIDRQFRAE